MSPLEQAKRWWQEYTGEEETPLDGDTPAWAVSLVIHVVVLLSLALVAIPQPPQSAEKITLIQTPVDDVDVLDAPEFAVVDAEVEEVGADSEQSTEVAEAVAPTVAEVSVTPVEADPDIVSDIRLEPLDALATAHNLDANLVVKGAVSGVGTAGASGAVDRLTAEINNALDLGPTVVCWLFDQSVSLAGQRQEIADRLERVFDELGVTHPGRRQEDLTNVVIGYGKDVQLITQKPTHDVNEVVEAIRSIAIDESGVEMTFTAVRRAAEGAKVFRTATPKRNVMIIAFTDEVGNDENLADQTAAFCRTFGIPVYVVGVPAPFGQRQVPMKFVEPDPDYDQSEQWAIVDQGPETLYPEVVRVRSGRFADDAIDSGFGPFSLCKLCAATQGMYFAVHPNRNAAGRVSNQDVARMASQLRHFFDPEVMRNYQPDYVSAATIGKMLAENKAKQALVEAAKSTEVSPMQSPTMTFPRKDDADLVRLLGEAQRVSAILQPRLDALHATLSAGLPDRAKIREKRWQAGYDLALGRVLAVKVRTFAYNSMLAQAKSGMKFKNPKNDTWELVPAEDMTGVDSVTQKLAKQATELLERVVAEHPGTPWALLAADELSTPLGYRWEERFTGVNTPKMDSAGAGVANPADDKKKMLAPPKPKRNLKNL